LGTLNSIIKIEKLSPVKKNYRVDILDNNGNFIAKAVNTQTVGIDPNSIIDEKKLLITLQIIFPDKDFKEVKERIKKKKYFRLKRGLNQNQAEKLSLLGDKSIKFEAQITRFYPQKNLFSHIIGQIDDDNNGISGIEKYFDYELKTRKESLKLTVDTDIQFLIREELMKFQPIFQNKGSAAILMNVNNGEILSMVSLPDFNLNRRENIKDVNYINRVTKAVYEFGSVFKTFTIAAGLNEQIIETDTEFLNLEKKIRCGKNTIGEYDNKISSDLTVEQILIRSGNIGSVRIGQKLGIEKLKTFLENIGVLGNIEFDIEEIASQKEFAWGKCKLATASFGHGISTTVLQVAKGYATIANGGFEIQPTLIKRDFDEKKVNKKILNEGVSKKINLILRKIVSTKAGTAGFANISGYEVGGKTGTAQKTIAGRYSKAKVNTFAAIFPTSKPKYVLIVLLDEPKTNSEYIYHYKDGSGLMYKGTPYNTAGWTSVEVAGKIIEKIGPILATKYIEVN
jgi:cell division protein FtsI (penicillin-binding protein 3)